MNPPLTTVAQPMREIGEGTVRLLMQILKDQAASPQPVTLPHILTVRSSTGPAASRR
jgi:DNA-binding LacI/PurR family transcriptional regulator